MIDIEDYIFITDKMFALTNDIDKQFIQSLYHELLNIPKNSSFKFIFNTLYYGGFLVNKIQLDREKVFDVLDV